MGKLGSAAAEAVPVLIAALQDPAVRSVSARAIGRIGPAAEQAIESLIPALDDFNAECRREAALALGGIDERASVAVSKLIRIFETTDESAFRWRIAEALGRIHDERAVEPLIGALSAREDLVRSNAMRALGRIGSHSSTTAVLEQLADTDWPVRLSAIEALGDLGSKGDGEVVSRLIDVLKNDFD